MDILHTIAAPRLEKITALYVDDNTPTYLLLVSHHSSRLQLWRIRYTVQEAELLQVLQVNLSPVLQVEAFRLNKNWCLLVGGIANTHLYCLARSRGMKQLHLSNPFIFPFFNRYHSFKC